MSTVRESIITERLDRLTSMVIAMQSTGNLRAEFERILALFQGVPVRDRAFYEWGKVLGQWATNYSKDDDDRTPDMVRGLMDGIREARNDEWVFRFVREVNKQRG